jgi:hypothetical protein
MLGFGDSIETIEADINSIDEFSTKCQEKKYI